MIINSLNMINDAPKQGWYIVYTKKEEPKLGKYDNLDFLDCNRNDYLEIHLFNNDFEYRAIDSRKGIIECVVKDDNQYLDSIDDYFDTENRIEHSAIKKIIVRNYLKIDKDSSVINISNYRFIPGGEE